MPRTRRGERPGQDAPRAQAITTEQNANADVVFVMSAPGRNVTARLRHTKQRAASAPPLITPSPSPMPTELAPALTANAELLCEFPFRPNIKKYRLMRRSRIFDIYCIPRGDFVSYLSAKPAPSVQVLLVPASTTHDVAIDQHGASTSAQAESTDHGASEDPSGFHEHPDSALSETATVHSNRQTWQSFAPEPQWTEASEPSHPNTYGDYARLGMTTATTSLFPGVLDGTGIIYAPLTLGEPREKWPTTIPLPGLQRVVVSFRPTRTMAPAPRVEHLLRLHSFDRPVRETVVVFRRGDQISEGPEEGNESGHWWLGELLVTMFGGVPSHNLGSVTIVGLHQAVPSWPRDQAQASANLTRVLDYYAPLDSHERDWSDVKAATFLSLEAYQATVAPAVFELETCAV